MMSGIYAVSAAIFRSLRLHLLRYVMAAQLRMHNVIRHWTCSGRITKAQSFVRPSVDKLSFWVLHSEVAYQSGMNRKRVQAQADTF